MLKCEDAKIIESCQHAELKNLLLLNRSKNVMLMQLMKKIRDLLLNCKSDINSLTKQAEKIERDNQHMVVSHLAAPYFKTKKDMFSSEPNADTLTKRRNGELSIYQNFMSPKWSRNECDNLISAVKMTYNHNKQKTLLRSISALKFKLERERDGGSNEALQIIQEIDRLEEELKDVTEFQAGDVPALGSDDFIDWEHISSEYLREKHSAFECRSFWHIYLHPDINKTNWEQEENLKILQLVDKYKSQDWDKIALELKNNRSGFSVYLHYVSVLCEQFSKMRFTKEEDTKILHFVERLKTGNYIPWNAIEANFPNRSRYQLMHRYKYFLSEKRNDQGPIFSDAEDILILILVDRFGRAYSKFKFYIPNRPYMQIKNRYDSHLRHLGTKGGFTLGEDHTLMKYMTNQNFKNVGHIATLMNRNRAQLRQRYKTLKTFLAKNPGSSLADAPRRASYKDSSRKHEFLRYIANQFKDHHDVPTLEDIEEKLGVKYICKIKNKKRSENSNIDSLLINYFSNSYKRKQKPIDTTIHKIKEAADTIFQMLLKWKVRLEIPEELKKNTYLDIIDVEILNSLRENYQQHNFDTSSAVDDLIPPNGNTVIGLRGLLLKNNLYKRTKKNSKVTLLDELPLIRNNSDNNLVSELINMLKDMNANTRNQIEIERCFFLERFMSLFMWPAIFSIQSPSEKLLNAELGVKPKEIDENPPEESVKGKKRAAKKSKDNSEQQEVKRSKLMTKVVTKPKVRSVENGPRMSLRPRKCTTQLENCYSSDDEIKPCVNSEKKKIIKIMKSNIDGISNSADLSKEENSNLHQNTQKEILRVFKFNNATMENHEQIGEVPTNLRRVDKSEIDNMLKNKKPVKMFMIQKIRMKDGTYKTIRKPYDPSTLPFNSDTRLNEHKKQNEYESVNAVSQKSNQSENLISKQLANASILDVVSFAESVKKECSVLNSENNPSNTSLSPNNPTTLNIENLNFVLKDNIKTYSQKLSSKLADHSNKVISHKLRLPPIKAPQKNMKVLKIRVAKEHSSTISNNVKCDDSIIDLTEEEKIDNEKPLSNNFIKSENEFDCF